MNIFLTATSPILAAQALDDRRVNNQVRETAQLLSTALRSFGIDDWRLLKSTHVSHPVTKWVMLTRGNFDWTLQHFDALGREKSVRYPDNPPHKNWAELMDVFLDYLPQVPEGKLLPFVNCAARADMDLDFKHISDPVQAYRLYLSARWQRDSIPPAWTNRGAPFWWRQSHAA